MLPIASFLCDVLPAKSNDPYYYKNFLISYTLITVPAVFSQGVLTPGPYEGCSREDIDTDVNEFIQKLPERSEHRRKIFRDYSRAAMIDPGIMVQDNEGRTFFSNIFEERSNEVGLSNRELILAALNSSAYLSYFGLFEETLSRLHWNEIGRKVGGEKSSAAEAISRQLREVLEAKKIFDIFTIKLAERSKFFANFETLSKTWSLLNLIRNRLVHHGSYYTVAYAKKLDESLEAIFETFQDGEYILERSLFLDSFEPLVVEAQETHRLTFCDALENCMRNLTLFVMESLVLSEREARKKIKTHRMR
ncbi:hypothetical protein [Pseudomonas sp. P42]|nr:hypothetical protein [Pseudomonas sp. P42]MBP5953045.1 hypothetical protein [Pseudomonas sp. P42]